MAKYKVNVIKMMLKNNKTAKSGDVVSGDKLINVKDAVKGNYVTELKGKSKDKDSKDKDSKDKDSKDKDSKDK